MAIYSKLSQVGYYTINTQSNRPDWIRVTSLLLPPPIFIRALLPIPVVVLDRRSWASSREVGLNGLSTIARQNEADLPPSRYSCESMLSSAEIVFCSPQLTWVIMWLLSIQETLCTLETSGKINSSGTTQGKKSYLLTLCR